MSFFKSLFASAEVYFINNHPFVLFRNFYFAACLVGTAINIFAALRHIILKTYAEIGIVKQPDYIGRIPCAASLPKLIHKSFKGFGLGIASADIVGCGVERIGNGYNIYNRTCRLIGFAVFNRIAALAVILKVMLQRNLRFYFKVVITFQKSVSHNRMILYNLKLLI